MTQKEQTTREKILSVAADHFAQFGFDGARMDRIAEDAGVNKASIYYNIGKKEGLYAAVLNRGFEAEWADFGRITASDMTAEEKLAAYIANWANAIQEHPVMPKIMMWEQISQGRHMPDSFVKNIISVLDSLAAILDQGVDEGVFERVDTVTLHFMMLGTLLLQVTSAPIRRSKEAFGDKYRPAPGTLPDRVKSDISRYILKAVKKG